MFKTCLFGLILAGFLMLQSSAQQPNLNIQQQRLLLEMSSAFNLASKQFTIDFDSASVETSRYIGVSRISLIGEGFYDHPERIKNIWPDQENIDLLKQHIQTFSTTQRLNDLALIGAFYAFKPGSDRKNIDSACHYLLKAKQEAQFAGHSLLVNHSLILLGKCYLKKQQFDTAAIYFNQAIYSSIKAGDSASEAKAWFYWGLYHPFDMTSFAERIGYLEKAYKLYLQLNDIEKQAACQYYIGGLQFMVGRFKESKDGFEHSFHAAQRIKFPYMQYPNYYMSRVTEELGNYPQAVTFALDALKIAEATKDSVCLGDIYQLMGELYEITSVSKEDKMLWFKKALKEYIKFDNPGMYSSAGTIAKYMNGQNRSREALKLVLDMLKQRPTDNPVNIQNVALALGEIYTKLGNYTLAEKEFLLGEQMEKKAEQTRGNISKWYLYENIGWFYLMAKQYEKSREYYTKALTVVGVNRDPKNYSRVQNSLYKIDSATGHYLAALNHYREHRRIEDSLFNAKAQVEMGELALKYNAEKKDNDINLLTKQGELKEIQLKQSKVNTRIMIGGVILLALLSALLYNRYRIKQKSNQKLEAKQAEINQKNAALVRLLEDKEWLIKEIHHRVKNNLQIVISLLNTQSRHLDNREAIRAVNDSRHRMQAMSLIHQKLYQSDNVAFVSMQNYIRELVDYLEVSFNSNGKIYYELIIDPIELDIAQAIPVGLILNEAITNCIKYAFVNKENGLIRVRMKTMTDNNDVLLEVQDNGVGLPAGFDNAGRESMGIRLIKGLASQIAGVLSIENNYGTRIQLAFCADNNLKSITAKELLNASINIT